MSSQQKEDHYTSRDSRKKIDPRKMLAKSRIVVFFQWFVVPDVRKVASLKRRVRSTDRWKKWHAAVARNAFSSQNAQNTTRSDQFLKVRCPKMARGCGTKRICKSKFTKYRNRGAILEVPTSKNRTPLWREADIFGYLTFKKWSEHGAFCSFWLANVLRATAACDFWTSDLQKVVRTYGVLRILIYKWRDCGAKYIYKSKSTNYRNRGAILTIPISKNCMPLWRETHL